MRFAPQPMAKSNTLLSRGLTRFASNWSKAIQLESKLYRNLANGGTFSQGVTNATIIYCFWNNSVSSTSRPFGFRSARQTSGYLGRHLEIHAGRASHHSHLQEGRRYLQRQNAGLS